MTLLDAAPDSSPDASNDTACLVAAARSGDQDAYDRLFALAAPRVRTFIHLRLGPALRAKVTPDDVLQDAYLAAHEAFGGFRYRGDGTFTRWLCRIVENRLRGLADHFGAKKRRAPEALERVSRIEERVVAAQTGPQTAVLRNEANTRLVNAIERLDSAEQDVLLLRFFQDRTLDDIAHLLGKSPTATRRLLGRATRHLGNLLAETAS